VLRAPAAEVVRTLTIAGLTDTLPIDLADRPDEQLPNLSAGSNRRMTSPAQW